MSQHKLEVRAGLGPSERSVLLDGTDITSALRGITIDINVESAPIAYLDVINPFTEVTVTAEVAKLISAFPTTLELALMQAIEDLLQDHGKKPTLSEARIAEIEQLIVRG